MTDNLVRSSLLIAFVIRYKKERNKKSRPEVGSEDLSLNIDLSPTTARRRVVISGARLAAPPINIRRGVRAEPNIFGSVILREFHLSKQWARS